MPMQNVLHWRSYDLHLRSWAVDGFGFVGSHLSGPRQGYFGTETTAEDAVAGEVMLDAVCGSSLD